MMRMQHSTPRKMFLAGATALLLLNQSLLAEKDRRYDVAEIPKLLQLGADAVIRHSEERFVVENPSKAKQYIHIVVTVLKSNGRDAGKHAVYYNRFQQVKKLEALIRNPNGEIYRKLKKNEIQDYSATSSYNLQDDSRVKYFELFHDQYPYTLEFSYEIHKSGLLGWTDWQPQTDGYPVEKSVFELDVPEGMEFRIRKNLLEVEPETQSDGGRSIYRWRLENLPKLRREPFSPSWQERTPSLLVAPTAFSIDGNPGDMSTWENFGIWYHALNQGRDELPPEAQAEVKKIIAGATTNEEKARRLYRHLQKNTRYVSIQLGIGGWQTFPASDVYEKGYGDCKALTNYMGAMLKAANVPAFPALIRNGYNAPDVFADFSSHQFNHVILCVPSESDTLWLECTSQSIPFNHIGASNESRNVLLVTEDGGRIIRTHASAPQDNRQIRTAEVKIDASGNAVASATTLYTGNQQDRIRGALLDRSPRDRETWLQRSLDIPRFKLLSVDFSDVDNKSETIRLPVEIELPRYASPSGQRLFLKPNLMERRTNVPDEVKFRTQPVHLGYAYQDVDSIVYRLPQGYSIEARPDDVNIEKDFARFSAQLDYDEVGNKLIYRREVVLKKRRLPAEKYVDYRDFVRDIVKADRGQVVLVKN